jgi:hypothetical protein
LEIDTLFRDAEEPIVFLVPMSTKISAEDLVLSFILHAPCPDFGKSYCVSLERGAGMTDQFQGFF